MNHFFNIHRKYLVYINVLFLLCCILFQHKVFDIVGKLGEGSYGSVFKALHKDSKQILAIKQVIFSCFTKNLALQ